MPESSESSALSVRSAAFLARVLAWSF